MIDFLDNTPSTYLMSFLFGVICFFLIIFIIKNLRKKKYKKFIFLVVSFTSSLFLFSAFTLNTWVGYLPSFTSAIQWAFPNSVSHSIPRSNINSLKNNKKSSSQIITSIVKSTSTNVDNSYVQTYIPKGYLKSKKKYPVIYAIHGTPGNYQDWFVAGDAKTTLDNLIKTKKIPPAIFVSAQINNADDQLSEPFNKIKGPKYEDFIIKNLIPWVDNNYRTIKNSKHRIIGGMSSGGNAGLIYVLNHKKYFSGALSLLNYRYTDTYSLIKNEKLFKTHSTISAIKMQKNLHGRVFYIAQDGAGRKISKDIYTEIKHKDGKVRIKIYKNFNHNWIAAKKMLPDSLTFLTKELGWK